MSVGESIQAVLRGDLGYEDGLDALAVASGGRAADLGAMDHTGSIMMPAHFVPS